MRVAFKYDMTATTAIAAVGSAFGHIFSTMEVSATGSALTRAEVYLYIINEIGICHNFNEVYNSLIEKRSEKSNCFRTQAIQDLNFISSVAWWKSAGEPMSIQVPLMGKYVTFMPWRSAISMRSVASVRVVVGRARSSLLGKM